MHDKMTIPFVIFIIVIGFAAAFLFALQKANPKLAGASVTVRDHVFRVEVARSIIEKSRGLSGRAGLAEGEGMWFEFGSTSTQSFWMKDMLFPIDIIWVSDNKVVGFQENAQPEPTKSIFTLTVYYSPEPVDRVLEVLSGTVAQYGIQKGDAVVFTNQ